MHDVFLLSALTQPHCLTYSLKITSSNVLVYILYFFKITLFFLDMFSYHNSARNSLCLRCVDIYRGNVCRSLEVLMNISFTNRLEGGNVTYQF